MNRGVISMRYAKALFAYAELEKASEEVFGEMEALAKSFALEPRLYHTLHNPVLGVRDKVSLIKSAISERVSRCTWRFIRLVVYNHREYLFQLMALNYLDLYRKDRNINVAVVESAVPIEPETEEHIVALIRTHTRGKVELIKRIDPDLVGGFIFQMNFLRIDASVTKQLADVQNQIIDNYNL